MSITVPTTFKPLKMGKWLALYEECALPVQLKYLGNLIGFFQTEIGTLNQVVHLWGFSDLNDRARAPRRNGQGSGLAGFSAQERGTWRHCCIQSPKSSFPIKFSPLQ